MDDVVLSLVILSLGGSAVGLLLMGLARLTRSRYAARWRCMVWALLCLRMMLPIPLPPVAVAPIQIPAPVVESPVVTAQGDANPWEAEVSREPNLEPEVSNASWKIPDVSGWAAMVWALGAAVVFAWSVVAHLRLRRYLHRWGTEVDHKIVIDCYLAQADRLGLRHVPKLLWCPGLAVPMLAGVWAPVLLIPADMEEDEMLEYALLHELIHHRRRDIWLKVCMVLTLSIHWFNPLMWWMVHQMERDVELACDETALKVLPQQQHRAYGETILRAAQRSSMSIGKEVVPKRSE